MAVIYMKKESGYICEKEFLEALKERCLNTRHLASLKVFFSRSQPPVGNALSRSSASRNGNFREV